MAVFHSARGGVEVENKPMTVHESNLGVCIHHWLINAKNFGVCKKCGEGKQFSSGSWYDASLKKNAQTKSRKGTQGVPDTKGQFTQSHRLAIEPSNLQPSEGKRD